MDLPLSLSTTGGTSNTTPSYFDFFSAMPQEEQITYFEFILTLVGLRMPYVTYIVQIGFDIAEFPKIIVVTCIDANLFKLIGMHWQIFYN